MNKQHLLNHLQNDIYCRIKQSKIHGVGVFAIREIPKHTNPFLNCNKCKYVPFTEKELQKVPNEVRKMIDDFFGKYDSELYIPDIGLNAIDISFFLNQSKKPNLEAVENKEGFADSFITLRNVKKGEELTVNYSSFSE